MNTVTDLRLRNWLAPVLKQYGQWLKRTAEGEENYKRLGRWSRWDKQGLIEANVNLEDLALRVRTKLNTPEPARRPHMMFPGNCDGHRGGIPGSR